MARPESTQPSPTESFEQLRHTLDQRIADHLEPLTARLGELERRLGHDDREDGPTGSIVASAYHAATTTVEERLEELERFERSEQSVNS